MIDSRCMHRNQYVAAFVFCNGVRHAALWCPDCKQRRGDWLGRGDIDGDVKTLDVVQDNSVNAPPREPCEVCGNPSAHYHHFAPQALERRFTHSVDTAWPVLPLCERCHREWHVAVTPDLVAHSVTLYELGARRSTTVRELVDAVRDYLAERDEHGGTT